MYWGVYLAVIALSAGLGFGWVALQSLFIVSDTSDDAT